MRCGAAACWRATRPARRCWTSSSARPEPRVSPTSSDDGSASEFTRSVASSNNGRVAGDQDEVRHAYGDNMGWRLKGYSKRRSGPPVSVRELTREEFLAIRPLFDAEDNPWLVDLNEVVPQIRPFVEEVLGPLSPDEDYYVTG